jgi:amidase
MRNALHWLDATATAQLLREKKISASELLEHYLARVQRINPVLNCIVALDADGARARAAQADEALARGEAWGPLHGVPMTVKDTFEVVGMPCTSGSESLKDHRPVRNATAVQRLLDAGAIVFGKTNVPPFASDMQTSNTLHGTTGNAWDARRLAGGSSGGSAVALAAGLTALELGSDIGGSSRNPAHHNGIFGMRPTWGTISSIGHIPGAPGSLTLDEFNSVGPMARSARDLRMLFDLVRGSDPLFGALCKPQLADEPLPPIGEIRLALWMEDPVAPVDRKVTDVLAHAVRQLRDAGAARIDKAQPEGDSREAFLLFMTMIGAITAARKTLQEREELRRRLASLDASAPEATRRYLAASQMSYADFHGYTQRRNEIRVQWARFFDRYDALLSPVIGVTAPEHGGNFFDRTIVVNGQGVPGRDQVFWSSHQVLASLPSVVVPAGFAEDGMPVGLQITTGHLEDYKAIRLAEQFAAIFGAAEARPPAWRD